VTKGTSHEQFLLSTRYSVLRTYFAWAGECHTEIAIWNVWQIENIFSNYEKGGVSNGSVFFAALYSGLKISIVRTDYFVKIWIVIINPF